MDDRFRTYFNKLNNKEPVNYLKSLRIGLDTEKNVKKENLLDSFRKHIRQFQETKLQSEPNYGKQKTNLIDLGLSILSSYSGKCGICLTDCENENHDRFFNISSTPTIHYYSHSYDDEMIAENKEGTGSIVFDDPIESESSPIYLPKQRISHKDLVSIVSLLAREGVSHISFKGVVPERFSIPILEMVKKLSENKGLDLNEKLISLKGDLVVNFQKEELPKFENSINIPISVRTRAIISPLVCEILESVVDLWEIEVVYFDNKCANQYCLSNHFEDLLIKNLKTINDGPSDLIIHVILESDHYDCCTKKFLKRLKKEELNLPIFFDLRNIPKDSKLRNEIADLVMSEENYSYSKSFVNEWISKYYW